MKETFYRKNSIGVTIEYHVVGYLKDNQKTYCIYTDFVTDKSNIAGIRLLVDQVEEKESTPLSKEDSAVIIDKFQKEILNYIDEMRGYDGRKNRR